MNDVSNPYEAPKSPSHPSEDRPAGPQSDKEAALYGARIGLKIALFVVSPLFGLLALLIVAVIYYRIHFHPRPAAPLTGDLVFSIIFGLGMLYAVFTLISVVSGAAISSARYARRVSLESESDSQQSFLPSPVNTTTAAAPPDPDAGD